MYQLVARVGSMFGIVDTDDGAVDWLTMDSILALIKKGVSIYGIEPRIAGNVPVVINPSTCVLHAHKCNWWNGENVFKNAKSFMCSPSGKVQFRVGGKTYKGKIVDGANGKFLQFSFNVAVPIVEIEQISSLRFN